MAHLIDGLGGAGVDYRAQSQLRQLWRFARPHTVIGTTLSLAALYAIALGLRPEAGVTPIAATALAWTWLACIGANVYIVGLNQLTDVPLDRINKPYLPLASGAWSMRQGWAVAGGALGVGVLATWWVGSWWLAWTVGLSLALGTAYSLPPLRLKRFPFWAALCIVAVRSLIVNLLLFAHVASWNRAVADLPALVWLLAVVMFAFSIAIAWFKDLPDIAGDVTYDVRTLPVRLGARRVLHLGALVLLLTLSTVVLYDTFVLGDGVLGAYQAIVIVGIAFGVVRVDLGDLPSIRRFYLSLWGWFFFEYLAFATATWIGPS